MFDPRQAEVVPAQLNLPALSPATWGLESMRQRFLTPPVWVPESLREREWVKSATIPAAVLIAIVIRPEPTVLLTVRSAHLPVHAGQIAFPGGKIDRQDASAVDAALREAQEEIGLHPSCVDVLGALPPFFTGTGFSVTPVVGLVPQRMQLQPNPGEVDQIFEVPLSFLLDPSKHVQQRLEHDGVMRHWYAMPYRQGGSEFYIWGVTASILRNFYHFLSA